jgi:glycosyltransferase involved in cell wall biosynthesis
LSDTLFTIITVVRNAESLIGETLNSILNQTYRNFELIIVDGISSDSTLAKVNEILTKATVRAKIISEPDDGIYDAMNKGVRAASGLYTIFINAGDAFCSDDALLRVSSEIDQNFICDVYFGDSFVSYGDFKIFLKAGDIKKLKFGMQFSHQATFVTTLLLKRYPFNLNFKIASDYDFLLNLLMHGHNFLYLQMPVSITLHGGISDSKRISTHLEYLKIINQHGLNLMPSLSITLKILSDLFKRPIKIFISPSRLRAIKEFFM